jgi:hypothetical protein
MKLALFLSSFVVLTSGLGTQVNELGEARGAETLG